MRVLVTGSGAREHAIAWKFSKSKRIAGLFIAPGNAGTAELGENLPDIDPMNADHIIAACKEKKINYVFIGPEAHLEAGLADALQKEGIPVFGPHKEAAQLETSKVFSKQFMERNGIPTAEAREFSNEKEFEDYINTTDKMVVIKKSGLAAGKGVLESDNKEELLEFGKSILKEDKLLVEEFLTGYEISIFTLCDGVGYQTLPPCADFKKAKEGDRGPNTGGMGAICPVPGVTKQLLDQIDSEIVKPTVDGLSKENLGFKGVIFIGLMITENGPKVLEYNIRFGDPETQVLMPLIQSDFGNLVEAIEQQKLKDFPISLYEGTAQGIVVAAEGYPGTYEKGRPVLNLPKSSKDLNVFHASTKLENEEEISIQGGRCFTVVGTGPTLYNASERAYSSVSEVKFKGAWFRTDIGKKFFI